MPTAMVELAGAGAEGGRAGGGFPPGPVRMRCRTADVPPVPRGALSSRRGQPPKAARFSRTHWAKVRAGLPVTFSTVGSTV